VVQTAVPSEPLGDSCRTVEESWDERGAGPRRMAVFQRAPAPREPCQAEPLPREGRWPPPRDAGATCPSLSPAAGNAQQRGSSQRVARHASPRPRRTRACRRRRSASAPPSLRLVAAPEAWRAPAAERHTGAGPPDEQAGRPPGSAEGAPASRGTRLPRAARGDERAWLVRACLEQGCPAPSWRGQALPACPLLAAVPETPTEHEQPSGVRRRDVL